MKKIIAIVIIILCVWLVATYPKVMLNPGELLQGHQELKNKCNSCHKPFWGIESEKCIVCHKLSDIGKEDSLGKKEIALFHQNLKDQKCTACHTDHKGKNPPVSLNKFDHNLLSGSERDKCVNCHSKPADLIHKQLSDACIHCHNTNSWKSGAVFNHDMIQGAEKNNCGSCHQAPMDNIHKQLSGGCGSCHNTRKWKPSSFDHSAYFQLDEHHNAACTTCHKSGNYKEYTCYGCHKHNEREIIREHIEHGISNVNDCISCHKSGNKHESEEHHSGSENKHDGGDDDD